jgi:hypothetical protein
LLEVIVMNKFCYRNIFVLCIGEKFGKFVL